MEQSKQVKDVLLDILNAHCMTTENLNKAYKLSGIKASLYNGKRDYYKVRRLFIRAISNNTAKYIINNMPFPFIEDYNGTEYLREFIESKQHPRSRIGRIDYWINEVLIPIPKKAGQCIECVTEKYSIHYHNQ
jgi:hypothetical protein